MLALIMAMAMGQTIEMNHQTRILDAVGQPLDGEYIVTLSLWTSESTGTERWSGAYNVDAQSGYVSVTLGTDDTGRALQPDWFGSDLWIQTSVDGVVLGDRQRFVSVGQAALAHTANHVSVEGAASGSTCTDEGRIVYDTAAKGLRVCAGGSWTIAGGVGSTNPVFGGANGDGIQQIDAGGSCATIKFDYPASTSGAYWIDPKGEGAYRTFCDMETLGGGWTLVAKIRPNDSTLNRNNTSQWRGRTYIGTPDSIGSENMLARTYEDVPFTDVMVRSTDTADRYMAWRHPNLYSDVFSIVDTGQRISDGELIGGGVQNLQHPSYPEPTYHVGCRALKYGFFGFDDNQTGGGSFVGHSGMLTGHGGGVVAASIFYDGNGTNERVDGACISDFGFGGGYSAATSGDDSYAINAHYWNNGNTQTNSWGGHALFVRHPVGDPDDGQKTGLSHTSPGRSCKEINDVNGPNLPSQSYWLESADNATVYQAFCDMQTDGGGWTLVSKLRGNSAVLNRRHISAWRDRQYVGSIEDLNSEDAIGPSYEHVAFTDVMLQGINTPSKNIGWRHPSTHTSVHGIVDAGVRVSDGAVLFGGFSNLDYCPSNANINPCSGLKYGFLGYDDNQNNTSNHFGHTMPSGHAGGLVSISLFRDSNGTGADNSCITDFAFGGGYSTTSGGDDVYNINAHWWGNGNTGSSCWNPHAFFVR